MMGQALAAFLAVPISMIVFAAVATAFDLNGGDGELALALGFLAGASTAIPIQLFSTENFKDNRMSNGGAFHPDIRPAKKQAGLAKF